jgi:hypothetical protein
MSLSFWRDVSIVWLSLLCFIGLVIPLVALFFAVKGLDSVHRKSLSFLRQSQGYSRAMRRYGETISEQAALPVIRSHSGFVRIRTAWQRLWRERGST